MPRTIRIGTRKGTAAELAIDQHVGNRIRLRRVILRITQEELSKTIGVTFQSVQRYESGQNRVAASRLYDIAKALKCPVGYFFEELPTTDGVTAEPDPMKAGRAIELVLNFNSVHDRDPELGSTLLDLLRRVAGSARVNHQLAVQ